MVEMFGELEDKIEEMTKEAKILTAKGILEEIFKMYNEASKKEMWHPEMKKYRRNR